MVATVFSSQFIYELAVQFAHWCTRSQNECSDRYAAHLRNSICESWRRAALRGDPETSRLETTTIVMLTLWLPFTRAQEQLWKVRSVGIFESVKGNHCIVSAVVVVSSSLWWPGRGEQPASDQKHCLLLIAWRFISQTLLIFLNIFRWSATFVLRFWFSRLATIAVYVLTHQILK